MHAEDNLLAASYDPALVALSIIIAVLASAAALDLTGRASAARGRLQIAWLAGGGFILGCGIWSMHYTGMLAYQVSVHVRYHLPTVLLSVFAAILASNVALLVASRERLTVTHLVVGSLVMGAGIATMHYTGMAAMRLPAVIHWSPWLVTASVGLAVGVSAVALWLAFRFGHAKSDAWTWGKLASAAVMGAAIASMHYTGMAAASFVASNNPVESSNTVGTSGLGTGAVVAATLVVLLAAVASSVVDRRISAQALKLQAALAEVKTLRGLFPICATCKRVRTDEGSWQQIEMYVRQHTEADFSHGICPDCARQWEAQASSELA